MSLELKERNALLELIRSEGFNALEFDLNDAPSITRLLHLPTGRSFRIGDQFIGERSVTWDLPDHKLEEARVEGFTELEDTLQAWLHTILEGDTPDLWAELKRERELITGTTATDETLANTLFTAEERQEIAEAIAGIKDEAAQSLDEGQLRELTERLDYLVEAAQRVGRIDWRNLVVGTLFSTLTAAVLPPEVVRHAFGVLASAVAHHFGAPFPQLPG